MAAPPKTGHLHIREMFENYFLDYASYVITDRAVPALEDGLKPVQRRLLHALRDMEDGRYHKAANIIGSTMKFHPHGDAAIGEALVNVAQKDLLIDRQGNWGDPMTGDDAAAPRYIECKLSPFALEVAFNPRLTRWQRSYDGRNLEPVTLPMKFPLLLAQGTEGIAVGLATTILPHNFIELCKAAVKVLKRESFKLYPDFPTGGFVNATDYNDGKPGGKVKVRAKIETTDKKALIISEVPYGVTTQKLMDSIVAANDKGKIKIRRLEDNTAKNVEIVVYLSPGTDPEKAIDALYAFTDCEVSISTNCCVIANDSPVFLGVSEILQRNVKDTVELLRRELELEKSDLEERLHFRTLERIFIEERIYLRIEKCETWEAVLSAIRKGLEPFQAKFIRAVTDEDLEKLTEIRIKRISRYDLSKVEEEIIAIDKALREVRKNLRNLVEYAIAWFENLAAKYGKGRERKTKIQRFEEIAAAEVILSNLKVFYERETGFVGTGVKSEEFVPDCSSLDDILIFTEDGNLVVTRVADKTYVGKGILYAAKFQKDNGNLIFNLAYRQGRGGPTFLKRFAVGGVTRDKQYPMGKGEENSKVHWLGVGTQTSSGRLLVKLLPKPRIKKEFEVNLADFEVKGRSSRGNLLTKYAVRSISEIEGKGSRAPVRAAKAETGEEKEAKPARETAADKRAASVTPRPLHWDRKAQLLGFDVDGEVVAELGGNDRALLFYRDGSYIAYQGQDSLETGKDLLHVCRWDGDDIFAIIYTDGNTLSVFAKRFHVPAPAEGKYYRCVPENEDSRLEFVTALPSPMVEIVFEPIKGSKTNSLTTVLGEQQVTLGKVTQPGTRVSTRPVKVVTIANKGQISLI